MTTKSKTSLTLTLLLLACFAAHGVAKPWYTYSSVPRENNYIVVLKEHVDPTSALEHIAWVESSKVRNAEWMVTTMWEPPSLFSIPEADGTPLMGYAVNLHPEHAKMVADDEDVEYMEMDRIIRIAPEQKDEDDNSNNPDDEARDRKATWALARVTNREWDGMTWNSSLFHYNDEDGEGVTAYVIDTGVNIEHDEFEGRASYGKSYIRNEDANDGNGHGTHVSSLIAGKTYGVASHAKIVAVRVLDASGSGTLSDVVAGISWVVKEHLKKGRRSKTVINMSLGSYTSATVNRAVNGAVAAGIHVVVASGNSHDDACMYSPAGASDVISVGASNVLDQVSFFSNFGKCVHVFAPGEKIKGAWLGNDTIEISGTSMASPMVAGIVSTLLSREGYMTPNEMRDALMRVATHDKLKNIPDADSPNLMGFTCPESELKQCHDDQHKKKKKNKHSPPAFDTLKFVESVQRLQNVLFGRFAHQ